MGTEKAILLLIIILLFISISNEAKREILGNIIYILDYKIAEIPLGKENITNEISIPNYYQLKVWHIIVFALVCVVVAIWYRDYYSEKRKYLYGR